MFTDKNQLPTENVEAPIAKILAAYIVNESMQEVTEAALTPDSPIIESGLIDSLGLFKMIAYLEDLFQVKIAPTDIVLENFANIAAIERLIIAKRMEHNARE